MNIACPNCSSLWDSDEINLQRCNSCGYPNHKKTDEVIRKETIEIESENKEFRSGLVKSLLTALLLFIFLVIGLTLNQMFLGLNRLVAASIIIALYSINTYFIKKTRSKRT